MQDEVNTKVVAIMIKGGKISAEVLKKALVMPFPFFLYTAVFYPAHAYRIRIV